MFSKAQLLALGVSHTDIELLEKRHSGGVSGGAGYTYQTHFVIVEVLKAVAALLQGGSDIEITQEGLTWVDDVIVKSTDIHFFQLKISPKESWNRKLIHEFLSQHQLCLKANLPHRLHLVTPHHRRNAYFNSKVPSALKNVFSAVYFPQQRSRSELWDTGGTADPWLRQICAVNPDSKDERSLVASKLISIWEDISTPQIPQKISVVLAQALTDPEIPIRRTGLPDPPLWEQAKAAISGVSGLVLDIRHGFAIYTYTASSGAIEERRIGPCNSDAVTRFITRILERPPTTYDAFWREL